MAINADGIKTPIDDGQRHTRNLVRWLLLAPLVLFILLSCGQLALLMRRPVHPAYTHSELSANYSRWTYLQVARINATALFNDLRKEAETDQAPIPRDVLAPTGFWPTAENTTTPRPVIHSPTASQTPLPDTPEPQATSTPLPSLTATPTPSATLPPPPLPTWTPSEEPEEEPTDTPVPSDTAAPTETASQTPAPTISPTSTATATATLSPTVTLTPSLTPTSTNTPTFTASPTNIPVYVKLHPIVENGGVSEIACPGRCRAYFGYLNDDALPVSLPAAPPDNFLDVDVALISPELPSVFLPGRVNNAFYIEWETAGDVVWVLDGKSATAGWCDP